MFDNQLVIQNLIGQGGSSNVYMATWAENQLKVAIKVAKCDKKYMKVNLKYLFEQEHHKMKMIEGHPNILKSYTTQTEEVCENGEDITEVIYNVVEFAENGSLAHLIRHTGGLGEELAKFYFLQIWHAVKHIHSFGVAHMDIKLGNILLDKFYNVKVTDFGASIDVPQTNGISDIIRGTKGYMAPEVSYLLPSETYDAYKADVYSLGIWLYVMLFGELPLEDEFSDTCSVHDVDSLGWITGLKYSPQVRKQWSLLSVELHELLEDMLSIEPESRPSPEEILNWDWLQNIYYLNFRYEVFEEMEQRMHYIRKLV